MIGLDFSQEMLNIAKLEIREWFDDEDEKAIPRLFSFVFRKQN